MRSESKCPPAFPNIEKADFADDPTSAVKAITASRAGCFDESLRAGCDSMEMCRAYSDLIDRVVGILFEISSSKLAAGTGPGSAVLALGGYGRREMGLATDIDLLFLIDAEDEEGARAITDGILYPFWDSGVEVGGATRNLVDCASIMEHDARAVTAMMDARLIAGDGGLLEGLRGRLVKHFSQRSKRAKFIEDKIGEHDDRLERYGGSIYLLQPNLKEGEGGLREMHTLRWVVGALKPEAGPREALADFVPEQSTREDLDRAHAFLWSVRHALHVVDPSSNDRLSESVQGEVAERLGYEARGDLTPGESFMSDYYMMAERMHLICERGIEMARREIRPLSRARVFLRRRPVPGGIMRTEFDTLMLRKPGSADVLTQLNLFATSRRMGLPVDPLTKGRLGTAMCCQLADIGSLEAARSIREIFADFKNLEKTLLDMHECGALVRWFPELAPMFHMVQHDGFHYYTAGVHSMRAVGEIGALQGRKSRSDHPTPRLALSRVRRPHVLALATLFHDVGKGRGGDHSETGAMLATEIAKRVGYGEADVRDVEFLVRSHLLMSTLAFRRDIRDPDLIDRFAQSIRSPEVLAMLYLLTFGDIRSIGPSIWSEWKGALLGELYRKTHEYMTAGGLSQDRRRKERERVVASVLKQLGKDVDEVYVKEYLERLPERYIHSVSADAIAAHILLARDIDTNPMATFVRSASERGCTELSVVTRDSPGLFAKIAGVLAANSANVVDAQIYTSTEGIAIDVLWVTDPMHRVLADSSVWSRIRKDLKEVLPAGTDAARVVGGRFKKRFLDTRRLARPTEISVENDVSALHTVVEVKSDDRRGLLYTIASTFHELDCTIDLARITTHVDRVIDVFYIRDAHGRKIASKDRLEMIRRRLVEALE